MQNLLLSTSKETFQVEGIVLWLRVYFEYRKEVFLIRIMRCVSYLHRIRSWVLYHSFVMFHIPIW